MFGWLRKQNDVADFWRWFEKNADRIRKAVERLDHAVIVHELGRQIAKVAPGVVHEIGKPDDRTVELILSADGIRDSSPGVLALMAAAPRLEGFLFTAFRPRRPGMVLNIAGREIGADQIRYVAEPDGDVLHLRLFIAGGLTDHERTTVGFLMLDQALGEYDVMTGVGAIHFEDGSGPPEAEPLTALPARFDAFRAATTH